MGRVRWIAPPLLAAAGAAVVVAIFEGAGGDLSAWPEWRAVSVPAAAFVVPAALSALATWRWGAAVAILAAVGCAAAQFALLFGVGFLLLGYGP